jgi:hypothetical protein
MYIEITRKADPLLWFRFFDNAHSFSKRADLGLAARDVLMKRGMRISVLMIMLLYWGYEDDYVWDRELTGRKALRRFVFEELVGMAPSSPLYPSAITDLLEFARINEIGGEWGSEVEYLIREEVCRPVTR